MKNILTNLKEKLKDITIIDFGKAKKIKPPEPLTPIPEPIPVPKPIKPPEVDK